MGTLTVKATVTQRLVLLNKSVVVHGNREILKSIFLSLGISGSKVDSQDLLRELADFTLISDEADLFDYKITVLYEILPKVFQKNPVFNRFMKELRGRIMYQKRNKK